MRKKLVVGNWKMNGGLGQNASLLSSLRQAEALAGVDMAVCVPFPYLSQAQQMLSQSSVAWGAQDLNMHDSGAFTGEVSGGMLRDFSCSWVIVGHSERRALFGEGDDVVGRKVRAALRVGLSPILCVGEALAERRSGVAESVVKRQLSVLAGLSADELERVVVAYEPIWAIGTGVTASPEEVRSMHRLIRQWLGSMHGEHVVDKLRILYGGSVTAENAALLFSQDDVDGGLVGGASLKFDSFYAVCQAASVGTGSGEICG